jgi:uncharacterized protein (UPF0332 family)
MALARESLAEARWDLQGGHYRGAVRSGYYAMFHAAEAALARHDLEFSSHHAVIAAFGRHFAATDKLPRVLHKFLYKGFDARQAADYSGKAPIAAEDAEIQIARAEEFLAAVETYLRSHEE